MNQKDEFKSTSLKEWEPNGHYPSQDPMLKLKQEMKLRGFSQKTVKSYIYYITEVLKFANKNPTVHLFLNVKLKYHRKFANANFRYINFSF